MHSSEKIHDYTVHMSHQGRPGTLRDVDTTVLGAFVTESTAISHTVPEALPDVLFGYGAATDVPSMH